MNVKGYLVGGNPPPTKFLFFGSTSLKGGEDVTEVKNTKKRKTARKETNDLRKITKDEILRWLKATAEVLMENKNYLTDLDSPIGDADHGINMDRGFKECLLLVL